MPKLTCLEFPSFSSGHSICRCLFRVMLVLRSLLLVVKCYEDMGIILTSAIIAQRTPTKHPTSPNFLSNSRNFPWISNPVRMSYETLELFLGEVKNDSNQAGSIRKDSSQRDTYMKFFSVMTSCRAVLWQFMTAFAILSVDALSYIFVMAESVQHLVPSLIVQNFWDITKSQIAEGSFWGKGNKNSQTWQSALLFFYVFVQESMRLYYIPEGLS